MPSRIAAALRNPLVALGVALTTAAGLLFALLLALQTIGVLHGAYAGLVVFVMVPAFFVFGLLLIPCGVALARRRTPSADRSAGVSPIDFNDPSFRRTAFFLAVATAVNLLIVSIASFGAVEYTESTNFCGQACHDVMEPEFVSHAAGPHGRIGCTSCHVGPGAEGFLSAKLSGIRQLGLLIAGTYARPIPTPIRNFPGVENSCESCHRPDRFVGDVLKVVHEHADDEANTGSRTVLRLHVGGPIAGTATGSGIHWHMDRANRIEYVALDDDREEIPYVRVTSPSGAVREYFADGASGAAVEGRSRRQMDCLDCHSRPAHAFAASPEREVDRAIGEGRMSAGIPFLRRESVRVLGRDYSTRDEALREIERSLREALTSGPGTATVEAADLEQAIGVTQDIYRANVFPAMKVGWGTHRSQMGHVTTTGCFRCHDDRHKTADGAVISQDCSVCHSIE